MNDFTKSELEMLVYSLYGGMHDDFPVPEEQQILQKKIQSMIDDYCEHELMLYFGTEGVGVRCPKCAKDFK